MTVCWADHAPKHDTDPGRHASLPDCSSIDLRTDSPNSMPTGREWLELYQGPGPVDAVVLILINYRRVAAGRSRMGRLK